MKNFCAGRGDPHDGFQFPVSAKIECLASTYYRPQVRRFDAKLHDVGTRVIASNGSRYQV